MKVTVLVKPNSKKESVTRNDDGSLTVRVNAPPVDGKANERVIELLSEYLVSPSLRLVFVMEFLRRNSSL